MRLCQSNDIMYTKKLSLKTHYRRQKFAYLPKNEKLLELVLVAVMFSNDIRSLSCLQKCGNHFFSGTSSMCDDVAAAAAAAAVATR